MLAETKNRERNMEIAKMTQMLKIGHVCPIRGAPITQFLNRRFKKAQKPRLAARNGTSDTKGVEGIAAAAEDAQPRRNEAAKNERTLFVFC